MEQTVVDSGPKCPSCGYELKGLSSDRCPECGVVVEATAELKHLGELVQASAGRRCAVCGAEVTEGPGGQAQRCGVCHSRYVRGGGPHAEGAEPLEGRASSGVAGLRQRIGVLPAPKPPPRRPEAVMTAPAVVPGVALVLGGIILVAAAAGLAGLKQESAAGVMALVGMVVIGWGVWHGVRAPDALTAIRSNKCAGCGYPVPEGHHGRCPECGKLVNELPEDERFCPGCRRTLRGFRGDACPECGADVRTICEGVQSGPA